MTDAAEFPLRACSLCCWWVPEGPLVAGRSWFGQCRIKPPEYSGFPRTEARAWCREHAAGEVEAS